MFFGMTLLVEFVWNPVFHEEFPRFFIEASSCSLRVLFGELRLTAPRHAGEDAREDETILCARFLFFF